MAGQEEDESTRKRPKHLRFESDSEGVEEEAKVFEKEKKGGEKQEKVGEEEENDGVNEEEERPKKRRKRKTIDVPAPTAGGGQAQLAVGAQGVGAEVLQHLNQLMAKFNKMAKEAREERKEARKEAAKTAKRTEKRLERLEEEIQKMRLATQFNSMLNDSLEYSESAATTGGGRDPSFKMNVVKFYESEVEVRVPKARTTKKRKRLLCAATGAPFEAPNCIASHLWKHAWRKKARLLSIDDVDNPRNGLILCKGVENAFDDSRLCIIRKEGALRIKILDPSLKSIGVLDRTRQLRKEAYREFDDKATRELNPGLFSAHKNMETLTFGDLEGRSLHLPALKQPFNRCLCFHAHQARKKAVELGWLENVSDFEFDDFFTEGDPYAERVQAWLESNNL